jgi:hypothetical protein
VCVCVCVSERYSENSAVMSQEPHIQVNGVVAALYFFLFISLQF